MLHQKSADFNIQEYQPAQRPAAVASRRQAFPLVVALSLLMAAMLMVALLMAGCQSGTPTVLTTDSTTTVATSASQTTATTQSAASPTPSATTTAATTIAMPPNLLTGEPLTSADAEGQRPVAIMINNIKVATPQLGIGSADLIYEMQVESGITRLLAVFSDVAAIPELGSIRSARHDYIDLAGGLDAIYVHFGGSYVAVEQLAAQHTDDIDLMVTSSAFWRDPVWKAERGTEHSVKTTGARLQAAIASAKFRTSLRASQKAAFLFRAYGEFASASGSAATQVEAEYSSYCTATFSYQADSHLYSKGQYGKPQIDLATGQALQFTNVFLLQTTVNQVDGGKLRDAALEKGQGYYISGGQAQKISWRKGKTQDSFVFNDEDGSELLVNPGKSYIGIIDSDRTLTFR